MQIKAIANYPWPSLADRINRRAVSRVEALRQIQEQLPLSESALRELGQRK